MKKLNITDKVLDKLGFSEYWDEHGTWGTRSLKFDDGTIFMITEQEEMDDVYEGYSGMVNAKPEYVAQHFYYLDKEGKKTTHGIKEYELFFIHEMYDCIKACYPNHLQEFVSKCESVHMGSYIESHVSSSIESHAIRLAITSMR